MSYSGMLKFRCNVLEMQTTNVHGLSSVTYVTIKTGERCFLDLSLIRKGKDPQWTAEAGRPGDKAGVLFLLPSSLIKSGHRIQVTKGPPGTYQVQDRDEDVWRPLGFHHKEYWVQQVPAAIAGVISG